MDHWLLSDLATFAAIVEQGSLRGAARVLGVKPATVSYRLKKLESSVGTTLLLRSTRSIELTEAGRRLLQRGRPALAELVAALQDARDQLTSPRGTLRLTLSHVAFRYALADHMAAFLAAYPEIELDLCFDDATVDLAKGGFHAGIRVGNLLDPMMIAVRLTGPRRIAHFAAPHYLERKGRPRVPNDLLNHDCIRYRLITSGELAEWEFQGKKGPTTINVGGRIIVNNTTAQVDAAVLGLGIAWMAEKMVRQEVRSGRLEVVLDDYATERQPFYIYFPRAYADLKVLRALVDFLKCAHTS